MQLSLHFKKVLTEKLTTISQTEMFLITPSVKNVCKIANDTSPHGNRAIVLAPVITCSQFSLTLFYLTKVK